MPKLAYARCKDCGATREEAGPLTRSRLCLDCAKRRLDENVTGIHEGHGPAFERRRYGIVRAALGPRLALTLKQAGVFEPALDDMRENA